MLRYELLMAMLQLTNLPWRNLKRSLIRRVGGESRQTPHLERSLSTSTRAEQPLQPKVVGEKRVDNMLFQNRPPTAAAERQR